MPERRAEPRRRNVVILAAVAGVVVLASLVLAWTHAIHPDLTPGKASKYPALILQGVKTVRVPWSQIETNGIYNGRKDPDNRFDELQGLYRGESLYKLIGLVDDDDPATFNVAKARRGYGIMLFATDKYTWTLPSDTIIGKKDWIIAKLRDGRPLPTWEGPYRFVGAEFIGFRAGESVRLLVRIMLMPKSAGYSHLK